LICGTEAAAMCVAELDGALPPVRRLDRPRTKRGRGALAREFHVRESK